MKEVILAVPRFFESVKFIVFNSGVVIDLLFRGGVSIVTFITLIPFHNRSFFFRTIIQPDGDIINILPHPGKFSSDIYNCAYHEHYEKVHRLFNNYAGGLTIIKWFISATFGLLSNYFLFIESYSKFIFESQEKIQIAIFVVLFILTTYLFQKYFVKYFLRFIFLVIRYWVKKKWISAAGF